VSDPLAPHVVPCWIPPSFHDAFLDCHREVSRTRGLSGGAALEAAEVLLIRKDNERLAALRAQAADKPEARPPPGDMPCAVQRKFRARRAKGSGWWES
jgi:hypothetical protein